MIRRVAVLTLILTFLPSCTKEPDPVVVDSAHYKVAFENDRVRVLHVLIGPHEKTAMHYHPESVVIAVTADRGREYFEFGKTAEGDNVPGASFYPGGVHAEENLSDKT